MTPTAASSRVCVARQPILDRNRKVFGYDLRFQSLVPGEAEESAADYASARVISDGIMAIGLDNLIDGRKAFVSVSRHLLVEGIPSVLPPNRVVVELSTDIEADAEVLSACRQLREAGYAISVDDFVLNEWTADLVPLADFLKVDFSGEKAGGDRAVPIDAGRVAVIAKGVETLDVFEQAAKQGCHYFQGFFFGRPLMLQGRDVRGHKLAHLRLLQALNNPDLSVHQLEDLIKHDAALCYRILRTVNSAAFATQRNIQTIREALVLLGRDAVRRWASLWALAGLNESAHGELIVMSTVRARCCETLASKRGEDAAAAGFLVGMCSLLDAILEKPVEAVLKDLPLEGEPRAALLGEDNPLRRLLDCTIAYERGDWHHCGELAVLAGIEITALPAAYAEALRWSRELQKQT